MIEMFYRQGSLALSPAFKFLRKSFIMINKKVEGDGF